MTESEEWYDKIMGNYPYDPPTPQDVLKYGDLVRKETEDADLEIMHNLRNQIKELSMHETKRVKKIRRKVAEEILKMFLDSGVIINLENNCQCQVCELSRNIAKKYLGSLEKRAEE